MIVLLQMGPKRWTCGMFITRHDLVTPVMMGTGSRNLALEF